MRLHISRQATALLLAGLLAVQALPIAHAFEHPLLADAGHDCYLCAHGYTAHYPLPSPVTVAVQSWERAPRIVERPVDKVTKPTPPSYRSRAPPLISC